jgi:hypothetical protein
MMRSESLDIAIWRRKMTRRVRVKRRFRPHGANLLNCQVAESPSTTPIPVARDRISPLAAQKLLGIGSHAMKKLIASRRLTVIQVPGARVQLLRSEVEAMARASVVAADMTKAELPRGE